MNEDRWHSVEEIAAHLGIKRDTVYKWVARHHLPAHKVGRLWKFRKAEVDDWVKSGRSAIESTSTNRGAQRGRD
jgi:excisionase family DNA binding protein